MKLSILWEYCKEATRLFEPQKLTITETQVRKRLKEAPASDETPISKAANQ